MMKDCKFDNSGFDKILRDKMDEMASSVDCFDKIAKRTFPENNGELSNHQFIVSDLENVTGKKKRFRFMPIAALAAAAVLCVCILPKSGDFMNFVSSNIGGSEKNSFMELINEIKTETDKYTYQYFDFTLDEYIRNDVMITPIYNCPFEDKDSDDINVRIFVKMAGDIPTNQIYAVEYEGKYEDGNYIAAADSAAKFTGKIDYDLNDIENDLNNASFISDKIRSDETESSFVDSEGNPITVASFNYNCIYKNGSEIYTLLNEIVYYHRTDDEDDSEYYYDINSLYQTNLASQTTYAAFDDTLFERCWNNVVYYNGRSAKADKRASNFTKIDTFGYVKPNGDVSLTYFMPFGYTEIEVGGYDFKGDSIHLNFSGEEAGNIISPLLLELCRDFKVYIPNDNGKFEVYADMTDTFRTTKYTTSSMTMTNVTYGFPVTSEIQAQEESLRREAEKQHQEAESNIQAQGKAEQEERLRKEAELLQKEMENLQ